VKAIVISEFGGPEQLVYQDAPDPVPGPGQVLIATRFIGVNFTDVRNRWGDGLGSPPMIIGVEVSGRIVALGDGVTNLAVGDSVAAFTRGQAYAELVCAPAAFTVRIDETLASSPASGGMMITVPLAVNVTERAAKVQDGETVLLHAAAGGVGSVVGQLMRRHADVQLLGTVSTMDKADFARANGYADVFTYDAFVDGVQAATGGRGVDVVLDPVGGQVGRQSLDVLAPFGRLVSYSNISREDQTLPDAEELRKRCVGIVGLSNGWLSNKHPEEYAATLAQGVSLVADGTLTIDVTGTWPLADAAEAHRVYESRQATGKLILTV
jgi:NADPH:quinone reductase